MTPTLSVESYDHQPATGARKAARRAARLSAKERHDEAIEELRRALAIDPQYYLAENNLGLEFRRAGKPDLAIATLEHLSKSAPNRVLAFNNLAEILYEAQRYPEMETVARQAQKIHPYSFRANLLLGLALVRQGSWSKEAKRDLQYASLRHPEAKNVLEKWPVQ
jgi:tetratricopeptide (TPR) repeat protein